MNDSLSSESFLRGAKKAAHRAMDEHGRREYDEFALQAGVAVEKLAKAVLAAKNPVYVAEIRNNSADMVMYLGGHVQLDEEKVRTVGATEAIKRLQKIGVLQKDPQLDLLIDMRNGAAHASPDSALAKGMISPLARTIETLLDHLRMELDTFWDRWTEAVKAAVNVRQSELHRDIQIRIAQARHAFDDRFKGLPSDLKKHAMSLDAHVVTAPFDYVEEIDGKFYPSSIITTGGPCPSCTAETVLLFGMVDRMKYHIQYAPDGIACNVCGLRLSGVDELAALREIVGPTNEAYDRLQTTSFHTVLGNSSDTD
ncbi:hypothetical protein [Streptomyces mirabilis]|uniref:hypothetical protein n=1 Tax=Streptomyces mirabilis TaxID=68239 RepID=UPI00331D1315